MLLSTVVLAMTLPLVSRCRRAVPTGSRSLDPLAGEPEHGGLLGGLALVFTDRYLLLLATLILLLNWVNTTGEYILAELVVRYADAMVAAEPGQLKADLIASFYGNFFFTVNLLTMLFQLFLVARIIRWIGVHGAVLILPLIAILGYGLVVFVPIFSILRLVKILENSTDYSVMNTTRHALYLPLAPAHKYEGKTAIEAFFWRFGDLAQAVAIYAGLHWFGFDIVQFAVLNMVLSVVWLGVAIGVSRNYSVREAAVSANHPPQLIHPPSEHFVGRGVPFRFQLRPDTFFDSDEGDVLTYSVHGASDGRPPDWLRFDAESLEFSGEAPAGVSGETVLVLKATDFDGARAEGRLVLKH
jgi:AAA family ATP:ADP antiporter